MKTINRQEIDPLETASFKQTAEILRYVEDAYAYACKGISLALQAEAASIAGDEALSASLLRSAERHATASEHSYRVLSRWLARCGYSSGDEVACGDYAVQIQPNGEAEVIGTVEPPLVPVEEPSEFEPGWSDRDDLAERTFDYGQMVKVTLN